MLEADAIVYFCQRLEIERNSRGKGKGRKMMLSNQITHSSNHTHTPTSIE